MPVYPVNSERPNLVSGVYINPYIVKNSSNVTVYLGQDSSLTVATRAFSLPPGSTLNWEGKTELWAITDLGQSGEVEILFDANSSFTPGPSTVNVRNDSDWIEPGFDLPATSLYNSPIYDVSEFQSIRLHTQAVPDLPFQTGVIRIIVQWLMPPPFDSSSVVVTQTQAIAYFNGITDWDIPVVSNLVQFVFVAETPTQNFQNNYYVVGNRRAVPEFYRTYPWYGSHNSGFTENQALNLEAPYEERAYFAISDITDNDRYLLPGIYGDMDVYYQLIKSADANTIAFGLTSLPLVFGSTLPVYWRITAAAGAATIANVPRLSLARAPLLLRAFGTATNAADQIRMNITYKKAVT